MLIACVVASSDDGIDFGVPVFTTEDLQKIQIKSKKIDIRVCVSKPDIPGYNFLGIIHSISNQNHLAIRAENAPNDNYIDVVVKCAELLDIQIKDMGFYKPEIIHLNKTLFVRCTNMKNKYEVSFKGSQAQDSDAKYLYIGKIKYLTDDYVRILPCYPLTQYRKNIEYMGHATLVEEHIKDSNKVEIYIQINRTSRINLLSNDL